MIRDYLTFVYRDFKSRKLRNTLTVLGIVIGIAAIVSLLLISNGLESAINEQFEKIGSNRVYIMPKSVGYGAVNFEGLKQSDVDALNNIADLEWITPTLYITGAKLEYHDEVSYVNLVGIETKDLDKKWADMDINVIEGRMFSGGEKYDAIIGYTIAKDMFDKEISVKENVLIDNKKFKVMGIMEEIGNSQDDTTVYIDLDLARELYDKQNEVSYIEVKVKNGRDINTVAQKITDTLKKKRHDENFDVMTPEQFLRQLETILGIVRFVLTGIAAISLLVAAVGIMNSLYTSVLEKTREIGIMKSVGAANKDILYIFLIKAGMVGFTGGLVGGLLGTGIGLTVGLIAEQSGFGLLKVQPSLTLILFGIVFAVAFSLLAGYLPARRASKLKPVDALGYG